MTSKSMRDAQDDLQPDVEAIEEFLTNCMRLGRDDGPACLQLTAIRPDSSKAPHSATFTDAGDAAKWAAQKNVGAGVYFVHGEPAEEIDGRVCKEDMARLRHIHADLDPPAGMRQDVASLDAWRKETRAAIKTLLAEHRIAAHIVNTGGGFGLFAPLDEPFEIKTDEDEAHIEDLIARFHALVAPLGKVDGTHDIVHLMRLPGTWNYPNEKKRDAGRKPAMAEWVLQTRRMNSLAVFENLPAVPQKVRGGMRSAGKDYSKLAYSEGYRPRTLDAALKAHKPLRDWRGNGGKDVSPSADSFSLIQTTIEALLALEGCAIGDLDDDNGRANVYELCDAFIDRFPERCGAVMAHLEGNPRGYEGKLSYDIDRAFSGSEPDRAPEDVKAVRAVKKLNAKIHSLTERREAKMQKVPAKAERVAKSANDDDEVTDAEAAFSDEMRAAEAARQQNPNYDMKPLLRHLAETGIETRDPIAFEATLGRLMTLAKNLGVDGATDRAIKKAYGVERDTLKSERLAALSDSDAALTQKGGVPFTDLVYLPTKNRYIHTPSGGLWTAEGVDEAVAGEAPSVILRQARRVDGVVWDPAEGPIIRDMTVIENYVQPREGSIVYNSYKPAITRLGNAKRAGPWIEHAILLYPDEAEDVFDAFAFFVQNPGVKINWAWMQLGSPGIGKDFVLQPLIYAVGDHNTKTVSPLDIMKDFDEFKRSQLLIVNELTDLGKHTKFALHEQLKPLIAAPPSFFTVNPKYGEKTVAKNVLWTQGMSNHFERALYLPSDDRRNFVTHTEITREHFGKTRDEQKSFWIARYDWMNGQGARARACLP